MPQIERLGRIMGPGTVLVLNCAGCGRMIVWTRRRALDAFGDIACPFEVRRRAVCSQCNSGRAVSVWVQDGRRL